MWKFSGYGSNQSYSCRPTPQPQQHRIQAASASATYTTAHGDTGSLPHWAGLGIESASSWILVGFITAEPQWELPPNAYFNDKNFRPRCMFWELVDNVFIYWYWSPRWHRTDHSTAVVKGAEDQKSYLCQYLFAVHKNLNIRSIWMF